MPFTKDNPRPGPGRPKGSKDKKGARAMSQEIKERVMRTGLTPLELFAEIYQDDNRLLEDRLEAAKAAAPFIHQKMPMKLDIAGEVGIIPPLLPKRYVPE